MNKPICILLCILLICLSVCYVFATDYTFTSTSDFVSAFNSAISFTATDYVSTFFVNDIDSSYTTLFNHLVSTYSIDTDNLVTVVTCENTNYIYMRIYTADRMPYQGYVANLTSGSPIIYLSYPTNTNFTITYGQVKKADGVFSNLSHQSISGSAMNCQNQNTNRASFAGFVPYHLTVSPNSQYVDYYTLNLSNNPGGGGDDPGQSSYDYIIMDKPPTVYGNLWTILHNGAWDDAAATYPSVYQNVTRGEFMFSDTSPGMNANNIFSAINVCGVLFESYMAHSYDFYDNISYNLATWMNTTQSLSEDIGKLVEVYASDQEIEAREAAAENQQAIVDNFLDSEGEGYVSPSDISSVSSMSDGYKTHMSTDAQPSGIWNIFNSNNFGWFSQETVNQLDTSTSNQRGSNTFETPYLDEKIRDIYRSLGVNYDD